MISSKSSTDEVLAYLVAKSRPLVDRLGKELFAEIDGEVFLGITAETVDVILPGLRDRERALLLARVETLRRLDEAGGWQVREKQSRHVEKVWDNSSPDNNKKVTGLPPDAKTTTSAVRSVTPPPNYRDVEREEPKSPKKIPSVIVPVAGSFPRLLVEMWQLDVGTNRTAFLAETWLPDLPIELHRGEAQTYLLGLRRAVKRQAHADKIFASRKWFGALVVSGKYTVAQSRLDVWLTEVRDVDVGNVSGVKFFLNLYELRMGGGDSNTGSPLRLIYSTKRLDIGTNQSSNTVPVNELVTVRFGMDASSEHRPEGTNLMVVVHEVSGGSNALEDLTFTENVVDRSRNEVLTVPVDGFVEKLKKLMLSSPSGDAEPKEQSSFLQFSDLLQFAQADQLFRLDPRFNRFEAYLLPTHEPTAMFGSSEFVFRSVAQIELLKQSGDYMRCHSQVVDLLIASWGFGSAAGRNPYQAEENAVWNGHSWLLRHALLSCCLLHSWETARRLIEVAKELGATRQIDVAECGFGEALFTMLNDRVEADRYWTNSEINATVQPLRNNQNLPPQRASLGYLISWAESKGRL